jgi:6-pyruvoyltetrahydropterin/6-carboxytetrahydropterin synthase
MSALIAITRRIEFDAGHRIPDHHSKCRNIHGHRYVLEATVRGPLQNAAAGSAHGMVIDFGSLKDILMRAVGDPWDHAFLVYNQDTDMCSVLGRLDAAMLGKGFAHKTVYLDVVPTVENLAVKAAQQINSVFAREGIPSEFHLERVKLWETPNCFAEWTAS